MLKNRSKAFAPKFKGGARRTPGKPSSAQSSARPSVEPHTQTPAPDSSTRDVASSFPEQQTVLPLVETETQVIRSESTRPLLDTEKPATVPEVRVESNIRTLKRKEREHDIVQLPAKRVPIESTSGDDSSTAAQDTLITAPQVSNLESRSRGEELLGHSVDQQTGPSTVGRIGINSHSAAANPASGNDSAASNCNAPSSSIESQVSTLLVPKDLIDHIGPTPQPESTFASSESDSQAMARLGRTQHSRYNIPSSDHEPPRFRYPTPPNMIPLSAIAIPTMSATAADTPGLGPAGDTGALMQSGYAAQVSRIVPMAGLNPDGTAAALTEEHVPGVDKGKKKKKIVRRKKVQAAHEGDDARPTVDMQLNRPRRVVGQKRSRKKKDGEKKRRTRAQTPEGAEDELVDHTTMKMVDLCKDLRIGKKFSKHIEIKERLVQKKSRAKMARDHPELATSAQGSQNDRETNATRLEDDNPALSAAPNAIVQMRVVDGQIVVDENTLQVDRQERGRAERGEIVEEVEEDDFTTVTTSGTFMKRERAVLWDSAANDLFYKGLAQFGTAFEMIAKLFPNRNRRQIKLKFNKEERNNPEKITRALTGEKISINLDEYEALAGFKLLDVEVIEAERAKMEQEQNAEEAKHAAELAESTRKKKADIQAKSDAVKKTLSGYGDVETPTQATDSAKENAEPGTGRNKEAAAPPKSKKKTTRKKNPHSSNAGGEEIEVLGSIKS